MPKIEGRASTRKTIDIGKAAVASFVLPWDKIANGKCCIKGCDHRASGMIGDLAEGTYCASTSAATIYHVDLMPGPQPDPYVGVACPHHVEEILDRGN